MTPKFCCNGSSVDALRHCFFFFSLIFPGEFANPVPPGFLASSKLAGFGWCAVKSLSFIFIHHHFRLAFFCFSYFIWLWVCFCVVFLVGRVFFLFSRGPPWLIWELSWIWAFSICPLLPILLFAIVARRKVNSPFDANAECGSESINRDRVDGAQILTWTFCRLNFGGWQPQQCA